MFVMMGMVMRVAMLVGVRYSIMGMFVRMGMRVSMLMIVRMLVSMIVAHEVLIYWHGSRFEEFLPRVPPRTRASGPCGRTPWDQGRMWPGGEDSPCAHQIVDAL
jgi:hypothetical protein